MLNNAKSLLNFQIATFYKILGVVIDRDKENVSM